MKNYNNFRSTSVCHNELDGDLTGRRMISDLEEAIKLSQNTKNGNPQCKYVDIVK